MKSSRLSTAEWEALLARIQSPSKELEASLAKSNSNLIGALSGLEELERLTQMHLAPHLAPPSSAPSSQAVPHVAQAQATQTQAPEVKYQTSHEEYAPALHQSALVEALLQYQRKKAFRSQKPAASTAATRPAPAQDIDTPAFSRSDFVPMKIPAIDAEPKAAPLGRAAAPGVRLPVLRLKNDPKPGANHSGNSDDQED
ncbi:MAG: hypothetical protein ACJ763_06665 [Bdellovibrionia bacterium]